MTQHNIHNRRFGLTVLECLFAMAIMLIGLVGIAAMIPFAGRQAADSYQIVQTLTTGDNLIEFANSNQVLKPTLNTPWQVVDDGTANSTDSASTFFVSIERLYSTLYAEVRPTTPTIQQEYELANAVLGTGFCMDPEFWGNQIRYPTNPKLITDRSWGNYRRTRFPFYHEVYPANFDPFGTGATLSTPRLLRISLRDPVGADANGNNGWLRSGASRSLAMINGGDITPVKPDRDRSSPPLRSFRSSMLNGELLSSPQGGSVGATGTWLATIVPSDESPIVEVSTFPSLTLPFVPESYDLSIVVFAKRDTKELVFADAAAYNAFNAARVPASSERLAAVSFPVPAEASSSSTFDVNLAVDAAVGLKTKVGDWLMLSRDKIVVEAVNGWIGRRQNHAWYRVISISDQVESVGPLGNLIVTSQIRLAGKPWGWTISELDSFRERLSKAPGFIIPTFPSTVATLVPHVINVYQRSLTISSN
ncbi:MAG: hypothetical protein NTY15_03690 [Planctomycetota bacterium]|nr:hypothetical protein [Planctomycetota bacterium]